MKIVLVIGQNVVYNLIIEIIEIVKGVNGLG